MKPEVMSPAGYWPQLRAAIEAGADAVYFGLKHFSARAKVGFALSELPLAMRTLHQRGVKGFVTFNSLVFDHELAEAARALAAIAESGADAIIVQDAGVLKLAREVAPELPIHASTQMSVTSVAGVRLAQDLGACRVTLARELSLDQARAIRAQTDCELEIFVHGALCVAYSGQCFSSEAWGGRSANRGQCAQACRLPYDLIVDGEPKPLGDARYLLSPGDLYALDQIPEIVQIGISALKIEGRYKDADYVALTTRAYRKAVDEACAGLPLSVNRAEELQLEQVYSRGSGPYFLTGTNHQAVVRGRAPRHRGVWMGRVARVLDDSVVIEPGPVLVKAGDGVVFDAADWRSPEEPEEGGRVYSATRTPDGNLELRFANGAVKFGRIRPEDLVWRTHDPDLDKAVRPYTEATVPLRKQPVDVRVIAKEGCPLISEWTVAGVRVTVVSREPLAPAHQHAVTPGSIREQFARLGNTPYELRSLDLSVQGAPFVPSSLLNTLRRRAVALLQEQQSLVVGRVPGRVPRPAAGPPAGFFPTTAPPGPPHLHLLVRTPDQLEAAIAATPATITLDYLDLYGLRPSVDQVKASGIPARVASPRILKPGEDRIVEFLRSLECPILVRSAGLLRELQSSELIGDFSLNAANAVSADTYLRLGLSRVTPTHDLNAAQVAELARRAGPANIEALAYHHLPVFHTEHCVFCRFLSTGTSYLDCGRPCEKHRLAVRDVLGRSHPVMADVGCRNTVFGAQAQEASHHLDLWLRAGIRHFRLEFAHESAEQVTRIASAFEDALAGRMSMPQLAQELKRLSPQGTTEGSLYVPDGYLSLPVLG